MQLSSKKIHVTIDALGNPKIEAEGFTGGSCAEATKVIEQALASGGETTRELKPEWYQQNTSTQEQHIRSW